MANKAYFPRGILLGTGLDTDGCQINQSKGADVASANALTLGTDGNFFDITGTTAITSIGTLAVGTVVQLQFDNILTLTHHATDLILPGGTDITTAAGDVAIFVEYATGDWVCTGYSRASGIPVTFDIVNDTTPQLGGTLDTNAKQVRESKGADVASATTLTLGTDGNYFDVTGTTTITAIATLAIGTQITLHFDDALTLTHHATDLILPGGANITTAAGDEATFVEYATGDWRCISYQYISGITGTTASAISAADAVTDPTDSGLFGVVVSGVLKKITWANIKATLKTYFDTLYAALVHSHNWTLVTGSKYTATPASAGVITMSDTGDFAVKRPVKVVFAGATYWGIVTEVSTNASITVSGPNLTTPGTDITALYAGDDSRVCWETINVPDTYADDIDTDLLLTDHNTCEFWGGAASYVVQVRAWHKTVDSTTQPVVNFRIGTSEVLSTGITLGAATTRVDNSAGMINPSNYLISDGDYMRPTCTTAGVTGDAADLVMQIVAVLP